LAVPFDPGAEVLEFGLCSSSPVAVFRDQICCGIVKNLEVIRAQAFGHRGIVHTRADIACFWVDSTLVRNQWL
jgi:hypothetical protein